MLSHIIIEGKSVKIGHFLEFSNNNIINPFQVRREKNHTSQTQVE